MTRKRKDLIKIIFMLFITFMVGFLIGVLAKNVYENSTVKPYEWVSPPIIVNCYNPPGTFCESKDWYYGFIVIRKAKIFQLSPDTLASTKRYTSLNVIKGVEIYYRPRSQDLDLINEHELGHALGFVHVEQEGHVMHPLYHKMGSDFWIPVN
jgi:hypothetical protein